MLKLDATTQQQVRHLYLAILSSFRAYDELAQELRLHSNQSLAEIVSKYQPFGFVASEVVKWFALRSRLPELCTMLAKARPEHADLQGCHAYWSAHPEPVDWLSVDIALSEFDTASRREVLRLLAGRCVIAFLLGAFASLVLRMWGLSWQGVLLASFVGLLSIFFDAAMAPTARPAPRKAAALGAATSALAGRTGSGATTVASAGQLPMVGLVATIGGAATGGYVFHIAHTRVLPSAPSIHETVIDAGQVDTPTLVDTAAVHLFDATAQPVDAALRPPPPSSRPPSRDDGALRSFACDVSGLPATNTWALTLVAYDPQGGRYAEATSRSESPSSDARFSLIPTRDQATVEGGHLALTVVTDYSDDLRLRVTCRIARHGRSTRQFEAQAHWRRSSVAGPLRLPVPASLLVIETPDAAPTSR